MEADSYYSLATKCHLDWKLKLEGEDGLGREPTLKLETRLWDIFTRLDGRLSMKNDMISNGMGEREENVEIVIIILVVPTDSASAPTST